MNRTLNPAPTNKTADEIARRLGRELLTWTRHEALDYGIVIDKVIREHSRRSWEMSTKY